MKQSKWSLVLRVEHARLIDQSGRGTKRSNQPTAATDKLGGFAAASKSGNIYVGGIHMRRAGARMQGGRRLCFGHTPSSVLSG